MPLVPSATASWLQSAERIAEAPGAVGWGAGATDSRVTSPLAYEADAKMEAARQAAFLSGPFFLDRLRVDGSRFDLIGTAQRVQIDGGAVETVFVLAPGETDDGGTELLVLRRI